MRLAAAGAALLLVACGHASPCALDGDCLAGQVCLNGACTAPSTATGSSLDAPPAADAAAPNDSLGDAGDSEASWETGEDASADTRAPDGAESLGDAPVAPACFTGLAVTPGRADYIRALLPHGGGVVVAGQARTDGPTAHAWLAWLGPGGGVQAEILTDGPAGRSIAALAWRDADTVLAAGLQTSEGQDDLWVTSAREGEPLFDEHTLGGSWGERAFAIAPLPGGGWHVVGDTSTYSAPKWGGWVVRLDEAATPQSTHVIADPTINQFLEAAAASPLGTLVAGYRHDLSDDGIPGQAWWALLGEAGEVTWQRTWDEGSKSTRLHAAACRAHGACALAGEEYGVQAGVIILLGEGGVPVWARTYGDETGGALRALVAVDDGGWVAGGEVKAGAFSDAWFLRVDADGEVLAERRFGGEDTHELIYAVARLGPGRLVLGGHIHPSPDDPLLEIVDLDGDPLPGCQQLSLVGD